MLPRTVLLDPDGTWNRRWLVAVIDAPTGVIYESQCAGVATDLRAQEGYLIPLGGLKTRTDHGAIDPAEFTAVFHEGDRCLWSMCGSSLPEDRLKLLQDLVADVPFWVTHSDGTEERLTMEVDMSRLEEVAEAWVPIITPDNPGVLMWDNCD